MKTISIGNMIQTLSRILPDLTREQRSFVEIASERSKQGADTSLLSDKEVEIVHSLYLENFV